MAIGAIDMYKQMAGVAFKDLVSSFSFSFLAPLVAY